MFFSTKRKIKETFRQPIKTNYIITYIIKLITIQRNDFSHKIETTNN